jgi:hypothetical protein
MNAMNWFSRAIGWGIVIYAIMYLAWSGLVVYGISLGYLSIALRLIVLLVITTIAARSLRVADWKDVLPYSTAWAATAMVLDALFLVPFSGWALYASPSMWLGYALVVVFPILSIFWRRRQSANSHLA